MIAQVSEMIDTFFVVDRSSIVGPAVFGAIWMSTVATFPKAIFVTSTAAMVVAFMAIMLIRLPHEPHFGREGEELHEGERPHEQ